jgi:hypothetical protein
MALNTITLASYIRIIFMLFPYIGTFNHNDKRIFNSYYFYLCPIDKM